MSDIITANDLWAEYQRLKRELQERESDYLSATSSYACSVRVYRDARAENWIVFAEERSATGRIAAVDHTVARLKGEVEATEAELSAAKERMWNVRKQLDLVDDVAGVLRTELRLAQ